MRILYARNSFPILIDDEWYAPLSKLKWDLMRSRKCNSGGYAYFNVCWGGKQVHISMSRLIAGASGDLDVDHINGCTTDNRAENLRIVTKTENLCNQSRHRNGNFPGVIHGICGHFKVYLYVSNRRVYLGSYKSEEEACEVYRLAKSLVT
jgi:hypothetical protein